MRFSGKVDLIIWCHLLFSFKARVPLRTHPPLDASAFISWPTPANCFGKIAHFRTGVGWCMFFIRKMQIAANGQLQTLIISVGFFAIKKNLWKKYMSVYQMTFFKQQTSFLLDPDHIPLSWAPLKLCVNNSDTLLTRQKKGVKFQVRSKIYDSEVQTSLKGNTN